MKCLVCQHRGRDTGFVHSCQTVAMNISRSVSCHHYCSSSSSSCCCCCCVRGVYLMALYKLTSNYLLIYLVVVVVVEVVVVVVLVVLVVVVMVINFHWLWCIKIVLLVPEGLLLVVWSLIGLWVVGWVGLWVQNFYFAMGWLGWVGFG